jgi:hypothetical protein
VNSPPIKDITPSTKITRETIGTLVKGVKPIIKKMNAKITNAKPRAMRVIATGNLENRIINP